MKNLPLAVQIWLLCATVTLFIAILIMVFMPGMLQQFFTQQVLSILEDSQKNLLVGTVEFSTETVPDQVITSKGTIPVAAKSGSIAISITSTSASVSTSTSAAEPVTIVLDEQSPLNGASIPFMNHIYFSSAVPLSSSLLPKPFLAKVMQDAASQSATTKKYTQTNNNRTLLYVIRKTKVDGSEGNLLSYSWGSYRNDMAGSLYRKIMLLMLVVMVLSWIPSLFVSRHLTNPLIKMENQVLRIGSQDWHEPLDLNRKDEIGRLATAFENMRERLLRQDQAQQTYLQNISHSLKTPIMVIQSYSKAILDGIYPKGDLNASLLTIENEADRTNKLVQDLLMLNKIKYLSTRDVIAEPILLAPLIDEIAGKLSSRRPELHWEIKLADYNLSGNHEQWKIVLENLLDNATRFALETIQIELQPAPDQGWWLRIWNDGMPIEDYYLENIFEEYYTGKGGQFGLGLAIVRHIVELHGGKVWAQNENSGVAFYIA